MITFLQGKLIEALPTQVVVDVNGIGSVSYTHLDVYKRQGSRIATAGIGSTPTAVGIGLRVMRGERRSTTDAGFAMQA